jgi:hypothetical protein
MPKEKWSYVPLPTNSKITSVILTATTRTMCEPYPSSSEHSINQTPSALYQHAHPLPTTPHHSPPLSYCHPPLLHSSVDTASTTPPSPSLKLSLSLSCHPPLIPLTIVVAPPWNVNPSLFFPDALGLVATPMFNPSKIISLFQGCIGECVQNRLG